VVDQVLVDNNSLVEKDQVLIVLRSDELQQEMKRVDGELKAKREQFNAIRQRLIDTNKPATPLERARDQADLSSVEVEVNSLKDQYDLLLAREEKLTVRSPRKGKIITWDAKRQLQNRPVETGQVLLTVAAEDTKWELELYMPERRVHHVVEHREQLKKDNITVDRDVTYVLMTQPGTKHYGKVVDIHWTAEPHEQQGHMVRVRVQTEGELTDEIARPGASVKAHVNCGRTVIGWAYLHEAWEWAQANVFFF
jgi:hypothetical protein